MPPLNSEEIARYHRDGIIIPRAGLGADATAALQVREMGVLDLSRRKLHLVRGVDRSGRNDIVR